MPTAPGPKGIPTRGRTLVAGVFVVCTFIGVWKFIDYRMRPPPPPKAETDAVAPPR